MKTTFIKGLIAEEIAKFHFQNMDFKIIHTGKESLDSDLANVSNSINSFKNNENENTFDIYNSILSKLPDFMIWKNSNNFEHKFVEVKYRKSLSNIKFTNKGFEYKVDFSHDSGDILDLRKYFLNLDKLFSMLDNTKDRWIDLYVYLVLSEDNHSEPNIFYGKVYKNKDHFKVDFFNIEHIDKTPNISFNWPNYKKIAEYITNNKPLFELFDKTELLIRNNADEIKEIINNKLNL